MPPCHQPHAHVPPQTVAEHTSHFSAAPQLVMLRRTTSSAAVLHALTRCLNAMPEASGGKPRMRPLDWWQVWWNAWVVYKDAWPRQNVGTSSSHQYTLPRGLSSRNSFSISPLCSQESFHLILICFFSESSPASFSKTSNAFVSFSTSSLQTRIHGSWRLQLKHTRSHWLHLKAQHQRSPIPITSFYVHLIGTMGRDGYN